MNFAPVLAAAALLDAERLVSTDGTRTLWHDLGVPAPGDGRTFRAVFGRGDETFRRLDVASRALVLAAEALGLPRVLPAAHRDRTAIVLATTLGCLDADRQFAQSLGAEMLDAPVFPYTLPSTSLGELALRHGLRGAGICLSVAPDDGGAGFAEAVRLLVAGEADAVVAGVVDASRAEPAACAVTLALLAAPALGLPALAPWRGDPVAAVRAVLSR